MKYLTGEDILIIHSEIIDKTSGAHGIRDVGLFLSIIERPKMRFDNKELYGGIFKKAAVYFESFAQYHVFIDGNKRTAVVASSRFLYISGIEFHAGNKEIERFALKAANKQVDLEEMTNWLKKHSAKIKK